MAKLYWMKLFDNFFDRLAIRKLLSLPDGANAIIWYQRLLLASLNSKGIIECTGIEDSVDAELALRFQVTTDYIRGIIHVLEKVNLIQRGNNDTVKVLHLEEMVGSESKGAAKMRNYRKKKAEENAARESLDGNNVTTDGHNVTRDKEEEKREEKEEKRADEEDFSAATKSIATEVISALNTKTGASYTADDLDTLSLINALLANGYTKDDLLHVIDVKVDEWLPIPKMAPLLKPSTLFGPKFADYTRQPRAIHKEPTTSFTNPFDLVIDSVLSGGD